MIAYIEGRLAEISENSCLLITSGGLGYEVNISASALSRLPEKGANVHFFAVTVVREDALELFGFESWDERETFLVLTSISRVGPRTALSVLSVFSPDDLRRLVAEDDSLSLTRVSGIGKKTGQQIFLELKFKLKGEASVSALSRYATGPASVLSDAVAGLANLGYSEDEALRAVKKILEKDKDLDVGELLKAALKSLVRSKV
ncbi:MAG: Holliday junction branch migration protein RuvA [Desulfovibrio sp.]|jgi:Holliday junction DNA helicase RuvA|nr:Holliday junction branch migration protein RuvA [Desulfovibrio sp.]